MKKLIFLIILIIIGGYMYFHGCFGLGDSGNQDDAEKAASAEDLNLYTTDGGTTYVFTYGGEEFTAVFSYDCWTIYDSYKITDKKDQRRICQALIDIHPVHGSDMTSYRTADDMAYEWQQHNLAYKYLPEDNAWRQHAANVDLDPYDQGRTMEEIYEDRTGQKIDLKEKVKESIEDGTIFEKMRHYLFD